MTISLGPEDVQIVRVEGGYFSYLEFEEDLWIMKIKAEEKGAGNHILREMIRTARRLNKNLNGLINPDKGSSMNDERMKRWYAHFGGEPCNNNSFRLRIRK
jgi:hypothetical protein